MIKITGVPKNEGYELATEGTDENPGISITYDYKDESGKSIIVAMLKRAIELIEASESC